MKDVDCPYCGHEQDIKHDEGEGYSEDETHQQHCRNCEKTFVFTTSVSYHYYVKKANCLNEGGEHKYEATITCPKECTMMRCTMCDDERDPTSEEMVKIMNDKSVIII